MKDTSLDIQKRDADVTPTVERTRARQTFIPAADIVETPDAIILMADMPGADEQSVDITLEKDTLTISGSARPAEPTGYRLYYGEYETGDYQRSFTLTEAINRDKIEATVQNGVLRLVLPKAEKLKPRKIEVKVAA